MREVVVVTAVLDLKIGECRMLQRVSSNIFKDS